MKFTKRRAFLFLLVISLLVNGTFASADFSNVATNQIYDYSVKTSSWNLDTGTYSAQGTGLQFMGEQYSEGTKFSIWIKGIYEERIRYYLLFENDYIYLEDSNESSPIFSFIHLHSRILLLNNSWDQSRMEMGPHLLTPYFFFDEKSFNTTFSDGSNFDLINHQALGFSSKSAEGVHVFEQRESTYMYGFVYDFIFSKKLIDPTNYSNFYYQNYTGTFKVKLEYASTTGVLQGYNLNLLSYGIYNNKTVSFFVEQIIEADGFRIGDFDDIVGKTPGYTFLVAIGTIIVISATYVLTTRRRRRKD
ncbi:MAG: choice-of-anchor S family protein [Candidatus Heimdallarchaeota archaeon]